jgi:PAS domain S-box-containing protein
MKVLYVEDNAFDADLLKRDLSRTAPQIMLEWVTTCKEAIEKLEASTPAHPLYDLLVTNMELPDGEGLSLIPYLNEHNLPIAVVVIMDIDSEESAMAAWKSGASHYVVKRENYISHLCNILETAFSRYKAGAFRVKPLRVLYSDHNNRDIETIRRHFSLYASSIHMDIVGSAGEALERISPQVDVHNTSGAYDVLLTAYRLPDMNGIELLRELRDIRGLDLPIVIITGKGNTDLVIQTFRLGGADCVVKQGNYLFQLPGILENAFYRSQFLKEQSALKAGEEYYRSILENITDIVMVFDANTMAILYISPSYERSLGYTPYEVMRSATLSFVHPHDQHFITDAISQTVVNPGIAGPTVGIRASHKDGSWRYMETTGRAVPDTSGRMIVVINMHDITERKEAEEKITESEESLQAILATSPIGIGRIKNRVVQWVNESLCRLSGYTMEELKGKDSRLFYQSDEEYERVGEVLYEEGKAETDHIAKDGSVRHVFIQISRPDADGSYIFTMSDMTEQKEAENTIRKNEERFRALIEQSSEVILLIDANRGRAYVSPAISKVLGYSVEEFLSLTYVSPKDVFHPDDIVRVQAARSWASEHPGETITYEVRRRHKDGSWRWINYSMRNMLHDPDLRAEVVNFHDITESKEAEEALKASEERFRALIENSSDVIMLIDANNKRTYVSPAISRVLGYSVEEFLSQEMPPTQIHPDDKARVDAARSWASEHPGETVTYVSRRQHKDGSWRWLEYTARNLLHDPNVEATVVNIRDTTERKEAEETLRWKTAFLEAQVNSSLDAILVVNDSGQKILENQRMASLWNLPQRILDDHDDAKQVQYVEGMTKDPQRFREKILHLYAHQNETSRDEIELKNGTILDRYTAPVFGRDGRYYGRIWSFRDITDRKQIENSLRENKERLRLKLDSILSPDTDINDEELINILDAPALQSLMDEFYRLTGLGISITDCKGKILVSTGWQDVCGLFHRVHPKTAQNCLDSALLFAPGVPEGEYADYICKNNLREVVTPLYIGGKHVGNIFAGQFLYEDEEINYELFDTQAETYDFDREDYFAALNTMRRVNRDQMKNLMGFLVKFSALISRLSFSNIQLARAIGKQRLSDEILKESETKYRSVVEQSLVGFYIIQNGLFRFVNKRFCEMHGYTSEEIVDKLGPLEITHPDDRRAVEENIKRRLISPTNNIEYEFRSLRKDGQIINLKVLGGGTIYKGQPAAFGTIIDTTKEKSLEAQLRQAQKMEALGTLAGGLAHDFNNILTSLSGYGTLLQMKLNADDPLQDYVEQIMSASEKAASLTQGLLAFSRQQPVSLQPVNINSIVKGTEKLLKRLLVEDVNLKILIADDDITVMGDPTQIDQILFNLTTNARDAMPKGGTLTIETKQVTLDHAFDGMHGLYKPGTYALLSVSDTGTGIDKEIMEHIFDPFFTTKGAGKGTGLGLSTIYGIIKQHNGYITVYSEAGTGTTFHIYLPAIQAAAQENKPSEKHVERGEETILVAEDSREVRHLIRNILEEYGYTIVEAVDGKDAIDVFKKQKHIDLLILDSVMPRKNGREAYDEIHAMDPDVKVLFTSGYTRDFILDKGIEDKRFDFISKPLSPKGLLEKVREVLDKKQ